MSEVKYKHFWDQFYLGKRVEIKVDGKWEKGTVVEPYETNTVAIEVKCDRKLHKNMSYYDGCGAHIMMRRYDNGKYVLSNLHVIDEPDREVIIPVREYIETKSRLEQLIEVAMVAVKFSRMRLNLTFEYAPGCDVFDDDACHRMMFDGKMIGQELEKYNDSILFRSEGMETWEKTLELFHDEVLLPFKDILTESYEMAYKALKKIEYSAN